MAGMASAVNSTDNGESIRSHSTSIRGATNNVANTRNSGAEVNGGGFASVARLNGKNFSGFLRLPLAGTGCANNGGMTPSQGLLREHTTIIASVSRRRRRVNGTHESFAYYGLRGRQSLPVTYALITHYGKVHVYDNLNTNRNANGFGVDHRAGGSCTRLNGTGAATTTTSSK